MFKAKTCAALSDFVHWRSSFARVGMWLMFQLGATVALQISVADYRQMPLPHLFLAAFVKSSRTHRSDQSGNHGIQIGFLCLSRTLNASHAAAGHYAKMVLSQVGLQGLTG